MWRVFAKRACPIEAGAIKEYSGWEAVHASFELQTSSRTHFESFLQNCRLLALRDLGAYAAPSGMPSM
jgi:hypothetical protein